MNMRDFWRAVGNVIYQSDVLLEVVDARMPFMTRNKNVENRIKRMGKSYILVLNKADLVTKEMRDDFMKRSRSDKVIFVSCKERVGIDDLRSMIFDVAKRRGRWGMINVGVVGYPNTGKSSVINALTRRSAARVSPVPGETRGVQWIMGMGGGKGESESEIRFLDTPGVIPPDNRDEAERAMMSVLDPDRIENPEHVALRIIQLFLESNRKGLEKAYGVGTETGDPSEILLGIGRKKHYLAKKGEIDTRRAALMVIRDWQRGKLLLNF